MRLWSFHPKYLAPKGLVALWREALLAGQVLRGATKGYLRHPQLVRFSQSRAPLDAINAYLGATFAESQRRGYRFDRDKCSRSYRVGLRNGSGSLAKMQEGSRIAPEAFRSMWCRLAEGFEKSMCYKRVGLSWEESGWKGLGGNGILIFPKTQIAFSVRIQFFHRT